jgi:hypothetical protein
VFLSLLPLVSLNTLPLIKTFCVLAKFSPLAMTGGEVRSYSRVAWCAATPRKHLAQAYVPAERSLKA